MLLLLILVAGGVVLAGAAVTSGRSASALATGVADTPNGRLLVERFIDRSRRWRRNGALVALLAAGTIGVLASVDAGGSSADGGNVVVPLWAPVAGSVVGAVLAEGFRVRPHGRRVAALEVRDLDDYRDPIERRRLWAVVACALAAPVASLLAGGPLLAPIALGAAVASLAVLDRWVAQRIALRPRPAVPDDLRSADDRVRRLAISAGVGRPIVVLAALLTSAQWGVVATGEGTAGGADTAAGLVSAVLAIAAVVLWWTNRDLGLTPQRPSRPARSWRSPGWRAVLAVGALTLVVGVTLLARAG